MMMDVLFKRRKYQLVVTEHAQQRMSLRGIDLKALVNIIETGTILKKREENKFWIYKNVVGREDNTVCLAVAIEDPSLVVITALVNWRPRL